MATFTWKDDPKEFPYTAEDTDRGLVVVRHGLVDTRDPVEALTVAGIPAVGDALGPTYPGVLVARVQSVPLGGTPGAFGTGGWCKVMVTWSVPQGSTTGPILPPGSSYTELAVSAEAITTYSTIPADGRFIPGGTALERGRVDAAVHTFRALSAPVDVGHLVSLCDPSKLNLSPIQLPPILGGSIVIDLDAKQARYRSFSFARKGDVLEIVHQVSLAQSHDAVWSYFDSANNPGPQSRGPIYEAAEFGALW